MLSTAVWQASPFETGKAGPTFRMIAVGKGLYFYAESADTIISDFRGSRMLSDAIFLGATSAGRCF